ncbi:DUF3168 domain-containing protein [Methylosinus sp. Sm6]|uniref:DUF3168 domain-containing protein n=1 Tax=Methylosinus sp. Sm6 TaxID=2866948 RepID=UPI001C9A1262|nr:DUF3168 domain-containing protein [Methylosinus sp. Sm6]MBY6242839.1 DUF3168 domain-containing protein [Methylosinus sp. Sm6]
MSPFEALRVATVARLKANAAVAAIVGAKIYDEPPRDNRGDPSDANAPFVYLGALGWRRVELGCNPGYDVALRIYAVSTTFGRGQVWRLHEAMVAALDLAELTLEDGHAMTPYKAMAGGDVIAGLAPKECFLDLRTQLCDAAPYP